MYVFQKVTKNKMCSPQVNSWAAHNNDGLVPYSEGAKLADSHISAACYKESISYTSVEVVFSCEKEEWS